MVVLKEPNGIELEITRGKIILRKVPSTLSGDVVIPKRVTNIPKGAFARCNNITSITLQDNVNAISSSAFDSCINLEKIIVSPDNKYFESDYKGVLFTKGRKVIVRVPPKFGTVYVAPDGVVNINGHAFQDCKDLTTLILPQTLTTIDRFAFENCENLKHINIPEKVFMIGASAFRGCSSLCSVTVAPNNKNYTSDDGTLFSKDKTKLLYVPFAAARERYFVPDGVIHIEKDAFYECTELTEVVLPLILRDIDMKVFSNCKKLTKKFLRDFHGVVYDKETMKIVQVWKQALYIHVFEGVSEIPTKTFLNCSNLRKIGIPKSVTNIEGGAFLGCKALDTIYVMDRNENFYTNSDGVLFQKMKSGRALLLRVPITLSGSYTVPEDVTHISTGAFEACKGLTEIILSHNVLNIDRFAFIDCPNLSRVVLKSKYCVVHKQVSHQCPNLVVEK